MARTLKGILALLLLSGIVVSVTGCNEYLIEQYKQCTGQEEPDPGQDPVPDDGNGDDSGASGGL